MSDYGYLAYLDEAGDPGLRRVLGVDNAGASEWLMLAAVVVRECHEKDIDGWLSSLLEQFKGHQRAGMHFADLHPSKKLAACEYVARLPVRCFVVASNKKNMRAYSNEAAAQIPAKDWFYCWMTRLVLERVTHFVRKDGIKRHDEAKALKIVFSERGGISYGQMDAYYSWLKMRSRAGKLYLPMGDLCWEVMRRDFLEVIPHAECSGLQLADVVASAFYNACDVYSKRGCQPQFAMALKPRIGRVPDKGRGQIAGYGVKLMPSFGKARLRSEQQKIFRYFGYPKQWWGGPFQRD